MKVKQKIIPETTTPEDWKTLAAAKLRLKVFEYLKTNYSKSSIINDDLLIPVTISVKSCRKTAYGEAMYMKKSGRRKNIASNSEICYI